MSKNTLAESLSRLYNLHAFGIKFGLDMERALLQRLGNPDRNLNAIHVAGTNGKGSVCAMLESILRAAGLKTGLYTSPHLIRFNERIRVNGSCITDNELSDLIQKIDSIVQAVIREPDSREITFFEFATAMAFEYFKRKKVDIAIIETGMGGRLDATNIVSPQLSVITGISLDHTAYLGKNIESITCEKCGIIKPGIPVVIGALPDKALQKVIHTAREQRARLIRADQTISIQRKGQNLDGQKIIIESGANSYGKLTLPLLGRKALENSAIATAAVEELADIMSLEIQPLMIKKGLESVRWPARFHILSRKPLVIVDGAHNPEGGEEVAKTINELLNGIPLGLILGMASDKDINGFTRPFTRLVKQCWAVPLNHKRSLPTMKIAARAKTLGWTVSESSVQSALEQAYAWARANAGAVCITGSLFLAGEVLELKERESLFVKRPPAAICAAFRAGEAPNEIRAMRVIRSFLLRFFHFAPLVLCAFMGRL